MASNIEIKAAVPDLAPIRARAAALASGPAQILEQTDTFFVVPRNRLKVRAFPDGSGELIAYDRPDRSGPKESVYSKVSCGDAPGLVEALGRALPVRGVVSKRREVLLVGRTRVHLDEVRNLGTFVELEVVLEAGEPVERGEREARALLQALHIPESALVSDAYIDMLEREVLERR
jgi:predicted adenylyl cyclase CyaB